MKEKPILRLEFREPQHGFWNGGAKQSGEFSPTPCGRGIIKWGCWEFNIWFTVSSKGSWKEIADRARRRIKRMTRPANSVKTIWA